MKLVVKLKRIAIFMNVNMNFYELSSLERVATSYGRQPYECRSRHGNLNSNTITKSVARQQGNVRSREEICDFKLINFKWNGS